MELLKHPLVDCDIEEAALWYHLRDPAVAALQALTLGPGESWELEEFLFFHHRNRAELLDGFAERIAENHPPLKFPAPPTGWCSWYCFGPQVTAKNVLDNLDQIAKEFPQLKYVQLDDGYQPAMGDWLGAGKAFGGDQVCLPCRHPAFRHGEGFDPQGQLHGIVALIGLQGRRHPASAGRRGVGR